MTQTSEQMELTRKRLAQKTLAALDRAIPTNSDASDEMRQLGVAAPRESLKCARKIEPNGEPPEPPTTSAFRFVPVGELQYRPPEYLIDGLIETDTLGQIFGDPGDGKSFVAADIGLSVSTGTPFHGRAVKQGPVFFIAGEGHNGLARRFAAWAKDRGVSIKDAPLFKSTKAAQFLDAASAKAVVEAVHELAAQHGSPALIEIDTLARNFGPGDENSTADMGAFVAAIDELRSEFPGCVALVVHHSGHAEKLRARGAMALKAALDFEYRIEKDHSTVRLVNTKMKDAEPPAAMSFAFKGVDLGDGASSAVLELFDAPDQPDRMTKAKRLARDTFIEAAAKSGTWRNGSFDLHLDDWRAAFYGKHTGDKPDTKRRAFNRLRSDLAELGMLTVENDVYRWNDDAVADEISFKRKSGTDGTERDIVLKRPDAEAVKSGTDGTHVYRRVPCPAPTEGDDCPACAGVGCDWCKQ